MKITFQRQGCELVAEINCSSGKRRLKGGGIGWFEVGFIGWHFDWKLGVQVSVTEPKPGHTYNDPQIISVDANTSARFLQAIPEHLRPKPIGSRPRARHFSGPVFVTFVVERDILEVIFPVPNCINQFHSGGWGCAEGKRIDLSSGRHHCQARLVAKRPNYKSDLRRTKEGIEFVETDLGQVRVFDRVKDKDC